MFLERIVSEGLAHFSYLMGSEAKAFVVDPRRDCQVYVDLAKREGMRITHIFETHRNEDYAIGSQDLVQLTGAKVLHGPGLDWEYGEVLSDGQRQGFGDLELEKHLEKIPKDQTTAAMCSVGFPGKHGGRTASGERL